MTTMEGAIVSRLLADSTITALVAQRMFPRRMDESAGLPAITWLKMETFTDHAFNTSCTLVGTRLRFESWAKTPLEAQAVSAKIRASLDAFSGTILGVQIWGIVYLDEFDDYEEDTRLYASNLDFRIWHTIT